MGVEGGERDGGPVVMNERACSHAEGKGVGSGSTGGRVTSPGGCDERIDPPPTSDTVDAEIERPGGEIDIHQ